MGQISHQDLCLIPVPMEVHSIEGILACRGVKIVGIAPEEALTRAFALQAILNKALVHGIVQLGCDLQVWGSVGWMRVFVIPKSFEHAL